MTSKSRAKIYSSFLEKKETVKRDWLILNAEGKTLGRFASEVTKILRGKHKPSFTPSVDCGDGVIIINADKIEVSGAKEAQKMYRYHSTFPGGLREIPYRTMLARKPAFILERAVQGMMPKSRLGKQQLKRLRVFAGTDHQMSAQKPVNVNV